MKLSRTLVLAPVLSLAFTALNPLAAAPRAAPAEPAAPAAGSAQIVATADVNKAAQDAAAYQAATKSVQTQYKAQIDAFNTRKAALDAELKALADKINADAAQAKPGDPAIKARQEAFQQRREAADRELSQQAQVFARPLVYAHQQVEAQMADAAREAMIARKVGVIVDPRAVLMALPAYDLTADITAALNRRLPSVSVTPPADWQPGKPLFGAVPAPGN